MDGMSSKSKKDEVVEIEDDAERESVDRATKLAPKLIYEVIRRDGEEELERPYQSLIWSGIAAGILISLSVLGEAIFRAHLPDADWRPLVENLGYSFGFIVVILGRLQLFTENTITTVLPVVSRPSLLVLGRTARLWVIVLSANVVGAFAVSAVLAFTPSIPGEILAAVRELSHHATGITAKDAFFSAVPAGVLIASITWMLPQSESSSFWVILVFTWLIAVGDFSHVVAGSVEMAYLIWIRELSGEHAAFSYFFPVRAGNIVGDTVIFRLLAYGQVKEEMRKD